MAEEEKDEFGIPIRKKSTPQPSSERDEFGILKKKVQSNLPSQTGSVTSGGTSVIGSDNPLNPATVRNVTPFNFAQQQDPETYNKVQADKQRSQQAQSKRLSELQGIYDQAQGQGAIATIQQQAQNRPVDTLTDTSTEPYSGIGNNVAVGLNKAYEGLLKIPRFVYSAAAVPQNFLADQLNMPELGAKYENFLQLTNATPVTSPLTMLDQLGDYYGEQAEGYAAKTQKYDDTITGSLSKGNFKQVGSQILDQIAESAPSIAVMAMTSGAGNVAGLGQTTKTLANALPFMSQRNADLQEDKNIPEWLKPVNAAANGLAEVIFDQSFGTQAAIQGIVNRFQNEGREAAVNAAKELTGSFLNGALKTVKAIKPFAKGAIEEGSTQLAQNIVDKYTINPDKDLMEGVGDAMIVGSAITGGIETAGNIALPKQRTQVRELESQQQALLNELGNENLSPQAREGLGKIIEGNQTSIENIAKETQEAIAKLNPAQKKQVADLNDQAVAAEAIVNDPNASEDVKKVAEQQIETISKDIDAIKPEKEVEATPKEVTGKTVKKGTDVTIDDTIELVGGKKGKVTKVEGDQITMTMENGATFMATPELIEMTNVTPKEAVQETKTTEPTETTNKIKETITEPKNEVQQKVTTKEVVEEDIPEKRTKEVLNKAETDKDLLGDKKPEWMRKVNESDLKASRKGYNVNHIRSIEESLIIKEVNKRKESRLARAVKEGRITGQEAIDIVESAGLKVPQEITVLPKNKNELVLGRAEEDLTALKQVTDKTKKYEASLKRLTEAKNNKEISTTEFNDLKKRFDDVIGERIPKIKEETENAIQEQSTSSVLQYPQERIGETGSERGRVEQGKQREEITAAQEEAAKPEEISKSAKEEKVAKAGDPLRAFASKVREGKINKLGGFKAATGFDGAWDLGLEAVATTIEGGAKIADAIESGLQAIKKTDWYKNLDNKEDFDTQYRSHMESEYGVEEKKATALKNKDIAKKREELGMEPREKVMPVTNTETINQAQEKIRDGYDTEQLIDNVLDNKKQGITAEEVVILKEYQLAKEQQLLDINDKIVAATEDGRGYSLDKMLDERDVIINDIQRSYEAGERAGTISARALQARKIALMNDYSLANMLIQKRKAIGGQKLSAEQIEQTTSEYTRITKLNEQLTKKIEALKQENDDLKANKAIKSLKNLVEYEDRKMGRVAQRESIDKDISDALESLSKKVKAQAGKLSMNAIPVDLIPDLAKLAKLYTKKGINTIEGIVDAMYTNLKNDIDGLTKEELKDVLINYDYDADAKQESRLKAFKTRTQARINEMRGRIDSKNFAKRKIEPIKLDKEAFDLQDALRKAKFEWDYEIEKDRLDQRTNIERYRDYATEIFNTPRAIMASIDYSAPLRQGLVLGVNNPTVAGKAFVEMFRQSWSEQRFNRWLSDLKESPEYAVMNKAGLYISDPNKPNLAAKEEQFMSNLAEKIPLLGRAIKFNFNGKERSIGGLIKGSERAYIGYLNKLRADVFAKTSEQFENEGKTIENSPQLYEALATYINSATGRGDLGKLENSAQILNSAFFSPRLIASRIRLLTNWANPIWYANTPKEVRWMYAKDMLRFITIGTVLISLAGMAGADVEDDPRSSDFGKIRIGDKRWDIWGGFQQFVRFFTQLATGQRKSTSDKTIREINGEGFRGETRADLVLNMMRSKLAPVPASIWNLAAGENMVGEEYTWKDVPQSFLPLFAADVWKATDKDGIGGLLGTGVPGIFGVGVQDYSKGDKPKTKQEVKDEVQKAMDELKKQSNKNN